MANTADRPKFENLFKASTLDVPWMPTIKVILIWAAILAGSVAVHTFLSR
jgi:hypothetical protein